MEIRYLTEREFLQCILKYLLLYYEEKPETHSGIHWIIISHTVQEILVHLDRVYNLIDDQQFREGDICCET